MQLVRHLQGQDGDVIGDDVSATPKKIFQILHQVIVVYLFSGFYELIEEHSPTMCHN